jgi:hypothetical protein
VKFISDYQLGQKLEKLKALKSRSVENSNELFIAMADLCLEKWEPKTKVASAPLSASGPRQTHRTWRRDNGAKPKALLLCT